jgi:hypothetical protein
MRYLSGKFDYDEVLEDDGAGGFDGIMGYNVKGHLDEADVEIFLQTVIAEEFWSGEDTYNEPPSRGWDVSFVYVRKVPREEGMAFFYQNNPGRGASKVTYFEINRQWEKRCAFHDEIARTGVPVANAVDREELEARDLVIDGYVYLCKACYDSYSARLEAERAKNWQQYKDDHPEWVKQYGTAAEKAALALQEA